MFIDEAVRLVRISCYVFLLNPTTLELKLTTRSRKSLCSEIDCWIFFLMPKFGFHNYGVSINQSIL